MLRPSKSILGSSRAAQRATARAELARAVLQGARAVSRLVADLVGSVFDLLVLGALPFLYLGASYFALDLPARWLSRRESPTGLSALVLLASLGLCLLGIVRRVQGAPPIAPVRPSFARALFVLGWATAFLLTVADLTVS